MESVPATDRDRKGALDELKDLRSRGRIDAGEFAIRSAAVGTAQTLTELADLVTDHGRVPASAAPPEPSFGTTMAERMTVQLSRRHLVIGAVVLVLAIGAAFVVIYVPSGGSDGGAAPRVPGATSSAGSASADPKLLSGTAFTTFRADLRKKVGSTQFIGAVIYPDHATIEVPIKGDSKRSRRWYYNGSFPYDPLTGPRRPDAKTADLADVDAGRLARAIKLGPRQLDVDRASERYVIFDRRGGRAVMSLYLRNKADDSGYWTLTLGGKTIKKYKNP